MVPRQQLRKLARCKQAVQVLKKYSNYIFLGVNTAILSLVFVGISLELVVNIIILNIWLYLLVAVAQFGWALFHSREMFAEVQVSNREAMAELAAIEAEIEAWRRNSEMTQQQLLEELQKIEARASDPQKNFD